MHTRTGFLVLQTIGLAALLTLLSCGGEEVDGDSLVDAGAEDTGALVTDAESDAAVPRDTGQNTTGTDDTGELAEDTGDDTPTDPMESDTDEPDTGDCDTLGCACEEDTDCASGYCIDARGGGRICSELCDGECSLEAFACLLLTNVEGEAVRICVEAEDSYCEPCGIVADCGRLDAACIEIGGELACVTPCDDKTRCPSGAECSPLEGETGTFCVPIADTCDPCMDEDEDGYGVGPECLGPDPDDNDPNTYPGAEEICDGVDNNGDGDTDEGFDVQTDPNNCGECGVVCSMMNTANSCQEGRCVIESCEGEFEDCDGEAENGCELDVSDPGLCGDCQVPSNPPGTACGECGGGTWTCEDDGWDVVCVGGDTLNACDGCAVLEGEPETACGACNSGVWTCSEDGASVTCEGDLEEEATNACGGCMTLDAVVDDVCGPCGGVWACDGEEALTCEQDLTDSDEDGVCDLDDLCEGFDDSMDADMDGIPNDCDETPFPDCVMAEDCDDNNICTDERCVEGECVRTNNAVACDDGLFCNGVDTCAEGVCGHAGSPCPGDTLCDEEVDSCGACIEASDCPEETVTAWSACGGFESACDTIGERSRTRTTYACTDSDCVPTETVETEACMRDTEGDSCAADESGDWGICDYGELCSTTGERTREVTTYTCQAEACVATTETQVDDMTCVRDTAGLICDDPDFGAWSGCGGFEGTCGEDGTRSRTVTRYTCGGGACGGGEETETEACARDTDGDSCGGAPEFTAWSACGGFESICDSSGTQTRVRTDLVCGDGACEAVETTEERACARVTEGVTCGDTSTTAWSGCGGFQGACGERGSRTRTVTTFACASDVCEDTDTVESEVCLRVTDGASCGNDSVGGWSSCGGFSNVCDEGGSRTRSRTTFTCGSGTCQSSTSTESGSCSRDTDGVTCDDQDVGAWSSCGGFSNTCDESGTQSRSITNYTCGGGSCGGSSSSETRACIRNTEGVGCGTTTYSGWSTCSGFADTCDNSGTQTRTRTDFNCSNASCSSSTTTESRACSRNTNGTSCGNDVVGAWSGCSGYSDVCDESGSRTRSRTTFTCGSGTCQSSTSTESGSCSRDTDGNDCSSFVTCRLGTCSSGSCDSFGRTCLSRERCCEPGICAGPQEECP